MFGCPGHGKGVWDGLGGIIKHAVLKYQLTHNYVMDSCEQVHALITQLFDSDIKQEEYRKRNNIQCKQWFIRYTKSTDTDPIREAMETATHIDRLDNIQGFKVGTHRLFFFEPVGVHVRVILTNGEYTIYRQLCIRSRGCFCGPCCIAMDRDYTEHVQRKTKFNLITILPDIPQCRLGEQWTHHHVRCRRVKKTAKRQRNADAPVVATVDNNTVDQPVAPEGDVDFWGLCELCLKWRKVVRKLLSEENYECSSLLTLDRQRASCDADLEVGAEDDPDML